MSRSYALQRGAARANNHCHASVETADSFDRTNFGLRSAPELRRQVLDECQFGYFPYTSQAPGLPASRAWWHDGLACKGIKINGAAAQEDHHDKRHELQRRGLTPHH